MTLHDIVHETGIDLLVMECVAGKSLARLISAKGRPLVEALGYGQQIASTLGAAHAAGIVHRDIKPADVIVTPEGQVKVLDFGLAKLVQRDPWDPGAETRTQPALLTEPGMIVGTAANMSPEQARGREVDHRTGRTARHSRQGVSEGSVVASTADQATTPNNGRRISRHS